MKKVKIRKASSRPEAISPEEWKAAKNLPEIEVNFVTALENVKNSKGMYEIVPDVNPADEVAIPDFNPEGMTRAQLVSACMTFGVTIQRKNIPTPDLRKLVQKRYDEFLAAVEEPDA